MSQTGAPYTTKINGTRFAMRWAKEETTLMYMTACELGVSMSSMVRVALEQVYPDIFKSTDRPVVMECDDIRVVELPLQSVIQNYYEDNTNLVAKSSSVKVSVPNVFTKVRGRMKRKSPGKGSRGRRAITRPNEISGTRKKGDKRLLTKGITNV